MKQFTPQYMTHERFQQLYNLVGKYFYFSQGKLKWKKPRESEGLNAYQFQRAFSIDIVEEPCREDGNMKNSLQRFTPRQE
jgi:hypothetical protein